MASGVALKAHCGILKGGGVLRTLKVASSLVSDWPGLSGWLRG